MSLLIIPPPLITVRATSLKPAPLWLVKALGSLLLLALWSILSASTAKAVEVPLASCQELHACPNNLPVYGGLLPADWEGAAQLSCTWYAAGHRHSPFSCPCNGVVCSGINFCSIISKPSSGSWGSALIELAATDSFDGQPWGGGYGFPTCSCPPGATFNAQGNCQCPAGKLWDGVQCVPLCPAGTVTYADSCTGIVPKQPPCPPCGNPVNPGVGVKNHSEPIVESGLLRLTFHYQSRPNTFVTPARDQPIGRNWTHNYSMRLITLSAGKIGAWRADGRLLQYLPPAGGSTYVGDADIADRLEATASGWRYTAADNDRVENYNPQGQLVSLSERNGQTQTLTYSDANTPIAIAPKAGLLIQITDHLGRSLNLKYNGAGRITEISDPAGAVYSLNYDGASAFVAAGQAIALNLTSIGWPGGAARTYHYNEPAHTGGINLPNALTGITDENGARYATYSYDPIGRAIATEHAGGVEKYSLSYSLNQTTITSPLNNTHTYSSKTIQGVIKNTGLTPPCPSCGGSAASLTHDANGNITSQTDYNGNKTCIAHDLARNLEVSRIEGLPGNANCASELNNPAPALPARRIDTVWHPTYRLPVQTSEPTAVGVRVTVNNYDPNGNLLNRSVSAGGQTRTWSWTYNGWGSPLTATDAENHTTTTTTYFADNDPCTGCRGQRKTIVNALGHLTQITAYNAHGAPLSVIDPNGVLTTFTYDTRNRLLSHSRGSETTAYQYDNSGQLTKTTLPDGSFLSYSYDAAHRLTGITDGVGNTVTYTLDAMGNRIKEETADPNAVLTRTRSRVYDNLNRLQQELGAQPGDTTQYAYDGNGNRTSITDPLNHLTTLGYDALNRQNLSSAPLGAVIVTAYDSQDNPSQITDPKGLITQYKTNGFGELTKQGSPDTGTSVNTYSANGIVLTRTDARGITATTQHDALNRITSVTYPDQTITYSYDGKPVLCPNGRGRLCGIQDASGSTAYSYDIHGRITNKIQTVDGIAQTLLTRYNSKGQLAKLTYPSGAMVWMGYANNDHRVGSLTLVVANVSTPIVTEVIYQPFGPVQGWVWGNDSVQSPNEHVRSYNLDGRLTGMQSGAGIETRTLTWDVAGRVSTLSSGNQTSIYTYDDLDRLTSQTQGADTQTYSYDATGNRLSGQKNVQAAMIYGYPATSHRLQGITQGIKNKSYFWDQAGNLLNDPTRMWSYGGDGRLKGVSGPNISAQYAVNALGQRVKKAVNGAITRFVYDEVGKLIGEYSQSGQLVMEHIWLNDTPVAVLKPKLGGGVDVFYVHADHLNTPRVITRATDNKAVWRWDNTNPFGNNQPNENPSGLGNFTYNLRLGGWQYYDQETGLFYNTNRYYDPATGRYTQFDPMGLAAGINGFTYVSNNPLKFVDPFGLAQIIPPTFGTFDGERKWRQKYKELFDLNDSMRERIKKYCPDQLERFDKWRIILDPNIDSVFNRARTSFAMTDFDTQITQFNWPFFNREASDPSGAFIFAHEYRHLMPQNSQIFRLGDRVRNAAKVPGEIDADAWAKKFWGDNCQCRGG